MCALSNASRSRHYASRDDAVAWRRFYPLSLNPPQTDRQSFQSAGRIVRRVHRQGRRKKGGGEGAKNTTQKKLAIQQSGVVAEGLRRDACQPGQGAALPTPIGNYFSFCTIVAIGLRPVLTSHTAGGARPYQCPAMAPLLQRLL